MEICPNCNREYLPGALFCSECGAQLVGGNVKKTQAFERTRMDSRALGQAGPVPVVEGSQEKIFAHLYLVDHDAAIPLNEKQEFTIGRVTEGQPILPDIDISRFDAYSQGVSRLHASIRIRANHVFITDLGSSNGTRVNGQRIMPNIEYPLSHGDVVALGKLRIQIVFPG